MRVLSTRPVHVDVGKGKLAGPVVVTMVPLLGVVLGVVLVEVVFLVVVLGAEVVFGAEVEELVGG